MVRQKCKPELRFQAVFPQSGGKVLEIIDLASFLLGFGMSYMRHCMRPYQSAVAATFATLFLCLLASVAPASANTITYEFTKDCCTVTSADTVTVQSLSADEIQVTVDFQSSTTGVGLFTAAGANKPVVWFTINPSLLPADTLLSTSAFSFAPTTSPASFSMEESTSGFAPNGNGSSFGSFDYAVLCSVICESSNTYLHPLVFTVTLAGIGNSTDPFSASGDSLYFVADVRNTNGRGNTGRVGATLDPVQVPEPMTLLVFGAGLAGLARVRRRKKV